MTAVVLAGGGERVVAWEVGVLAGLADGGLDLRRATAVVGTSAGALVAARLALGVDPRADADRIAAAPPRRGRGVDGAAAFASLARAWEAAGGTIRQRRRAMGRLALDRSPGGEDDAVERIAARLPGDGWPAALRVVAVDAERGERIVFDAAARVAPERAVAASRAVPVLRAPVTAGGRRCIDGALGSATNADVLAGLAPATVIVVAPVPTDRPPAGPERVWLAALRDEVATLERAGHHVLVIQASARDRVAMGRDPMSGATARLAVAAGRARAGQISPRRAA